MTLHPATRRKLANHLAWKLIHISTFEPGTPEAWAQGGWYNGFVSCLYTQYGIPAGDLIVAEAHTIVHDNAVEEIR